MKKHIISAIMIMICHGAHSSQENTATYSGFNIPKIKANVTMPSVSQQISQTTDAFKKGPFANILRAREEALTRLTTLINQRIHQIQGMADDYMNLQHIIINQKHGGIGPRKNRFALTDKIQALKNDIAQAGSKQNLQPEPAIGFTDPNQVATLNRVRQHISSLIDTFNSYTYDLNSILEYYQTLYQTEKINPNHRQAIEGILNKIRDTRQPAVESLVNRARTDNSQSADLARKSGLVQ